MPVGALKETKKQLHLRNSSTITKPYVSYDLKLCIAFHRQFSWPLSYIQRMTTVIYAFQEYLLFICSFITWTSVQFQVSNFPYMQCPHKLTGVWCMRSFTITLYLLPHEDLWTSLCEWAMASHPHQYQRGECKFTEKINENWLWSYSSTSVGLWTWNRVGIIVLILFCFGQSTEMKWVYIGFVFNFVHFGWNQRFHP